MGYGVFLNVNRIGRSKAVTSIPFSKGTIDRQLQGLMNVPNTLSITGDMRKDIVTRDAANRIKVKAPLLTADKIL